MAKNRDPKAIEFNGTNFDIILRTLLKMKSQMTLKALKCKEKYEGNESDLSRSSLSTLSSPDLNMTPKEIKRRNRKNRDQISVLLKEYEENSQWDKDFIQELSKKTGLSEAQIYKWNWDYKKKSKRSIGSCFIDTKLICNENLAPLQFDKDLLVVQRLYKISYSGYEH